MEWGNFVAEKNEGILFSVEIQVVGSYMDCLLTFLTFFHRGSKHISLSLHPVEVMLLGNLNTTRHHNQ